ncbi:MAG: DNA double-strand break repair nuclease NurA [Candidatus Caldarchaeum sp.]
MSLIQEEEEVRTYTELVKRLEDGLKHFMDVEAERFASAASMFTPPPRAKVSPSRKTWRVAAVDGGSGILSFADIDIGFATALAVIHDGAEYRRQLLQPKLLVQEYGEADGEFSDRVDVERETMLLMLAQKVVRDNDLELLIVDGPLIPRPKYVGEYVYQLRTLIELCRERGVVVAGFVKRPQSRYLSELGFTDRALLSAVLDKMEAAPWPPTAPPTEKTDVRYTYIKLLNEPEAGVFRIDFPPFVDDRQALEALEYFAYSSDPVHGPPAILMKADEEVKVSRRLVTELYRSCITGVMSRVPRKLWAPLVPRWGERIW